MHNKHIIFPPEMPENTTFDKSKFACKYEATPNR